MLKTLTPFLLAAFTLLPQEANDRITVPLSDPSRPAQVKVTLMAGGITVRAYPGKEVVVERQKRAAGEKPREDKTPPKAQGLKRFDGGGSGDLDVEESGNSVTIQTENMARTQNLLVLVPVNTSLNLKTMANGEIVVEGVHGEIAANNMNGKVTLRGVSGTVLANSMNGDVTVVMDRVDPNKPSSFSTMNGDIDVTLPSDTKARLKLKANNGEVFSDFDIRPDGTAGKPVSETGKGKRKVHVDQTTFGTINGGGPEFQFNTFNGQIMIRKK